MDNSSCAPIAIEDSSCQQKEIRNNRSASMMKTLTKVSNTSDIIELDMQIEKCYYENASTFRSYVSSLGQNKIIVLIYDLEKVEGDVKNIYEKILGY